MFNGITITKEYIDNFINKAQLLSNNLITIETGAEPVLLFYSNIFMLYT